jgi:hypothetical protein
MRRILVGISVGARGAADLPAPTLPSDVDALMAHRAVYARIVARGWGDEQPWDDNGCDSIDQPVDGLLHKYAGSWNIVTLVNKPWVRREDFIARSRLWPKRGISGAAIVTWRYCRGRAGWTSDSFPALYIALGRG